MLKIKCPKCNEEIELGKDQYNALLNDIEKEELDKRVKERVGEIEKTYKAQYELDANKMKTAQDNLINELNSQIKLLKEKLSSSNKDVEIAVTKAVETLKGDLNAKELELAHMKSQLDSLMKDSNISAQKLKEQYEFQLKAKDEEIKHWKEFRIGDSTKDIGESLEQYCHDKFDEIRAIAYPNAYFEKDNEVIGGTKGDFVFRDYSDEDSEHETVSIMFEMKNQKEDGDTKNESHLKKLDSDRQKKKCEYAVLVSTLEPESNLYNAGIVDVSHKYPKMFVVRPQFFLTIIGLIKNMAKTRFEYKKQVIQYQRENIDITNFENAVRVVAQKISDDYENAGKQYDKVEKMCDDMIKKLTDLKEVFRLGKKWIGTAQNQLPELEIRKLTKNNPTMKEKFDALEHKDDEGGN
jgi:hypothetical protein